jgi:hypothetical protein
MDCMFCYYHLKIKEIDFLNNEFNLKLQVQITYAIQGHCYEKEKSYPIRYLYRLFQKRMYLNRFSV